MKRKLIPTDFIDPSTGEPLYVTMRKPRRWRYLLAEIRLFVGIVWRPMDVGRLDWRTAWEIAFSKRASISGNGVIFQRIHIRPQQQRRTNP